MRNIRLGLMMAVALGALATSASANATEIPGGAGGSAAVSGANSSVGAAALKYEHSQGLPTTIATGPLGPKFLKVGVTLKIEPVTNGGPLYVVDMPRGALVEASWGNDKRITLKAKNGTETDGLVSVRHTLTPSVDLMFSGFGLNATFNYDATDLVNKIPGAKFDYISEQKQSFLPWGFKTVETKLNAPELDRATLFSMEMERLPELLSNNVGGFFGVRATTKPTFAYKTTKITMAGADGQIADESGALTVPAVDGDFMEVMAAVEGEMAVNGSISVLPFVKLTRVAGMDMAMDVDFDVYNKTYATPASKVNFQTVTVHIPMPNVHTPSKGVNFGSVKANGNASKTVTIENSGEKEATVSFASSESQFKVPSGTVTIPAKGTYDLSIKFSPDSAAAVEGVITVSSNDADAPEQTFKIGANGADVGDESDDRKGGVQSQDGCGCKATGSSKLPGSFGLLAGALGLGLIAARRRRS